MGLNVTWATFKELGQRSQLFQTTLEAGFTMAKLPGYWASAGKWLVWRLLPDLSSLCSCLTQRCYAEALQLQ